MIDRRRVAEEAANATWRIEGLRCSLAALTVWRLARRVARGAEKARRTEGAALEARLAAADAASASADRSREADRVAMERTAASTAAATSAVADMRAALEGRRGRASLLAEVSGSVADVSGRVDGVVEGAGIAAGRPRTPTSPLPATALHAYRGAAGALQSVAELGVVVVKEARPATRALATQLEVGGDGRQRRPLQPLRAPRGHAALGGDGRRGPRRRRYRR